jgi:ribulose-phosphate 3-epimerase
MNHKIPVKLAPSILSADFSCLGDQVREAIRPITQPAGVLLDVHLMIEKPERLIPDFARAGAGSITVHVETCPHLHRTIEQIKTGGIRAGVTLNPATPLAALEEILPYVDMVLIMSVNPGFGNQAYIANSTAKISRLARICQERNLEHIEVEVDGGIKRSNVAEVVNAGASVIVVGSAIFNSDASITANMEALRKAIA